MGAPKLKRAKPEVVDYHDYRVFLRDWIGYRHEQDPEFSLRSLARVAQVGASTISMILNGQRGLSSELLEKLSPGLGLSPAELKYFDLLRGMSEAPNAEIRAATVGRIQKSKKYKLRHPKEFETFNYLSHWYYVVIREMAGLPGFKADPEWIQSRLRDYVAIGDIQQALNFLNEHGFLAAENAGKQLDCMGGVFKMALGSFHKQMLDQISTAIDEIPADERHVLGHTMALPSERLAEAKAILNEALTKIESLGAVPGAVDTVYHVELALIPVTRKSKGEDV